MKDLFPEQEGPSKLVATYRYLDENGKLLYEKQRFEPKGFTQRRPNGIGWDYRLGDVRQVLYRLPEVVSSAPRTVIVTEGEKSADALAALGLVATCSGGAGKWRREFGESLRGRNVVLLPDNDPVGFEHVEAVSQSLHGIALSVRVVALPGLKEKADVFDWLAAGGTRAQLENLARRTAPEEKPLTLMVLAGKVEELRRQVEQLTKGTK